MKAGLVKLFIIFLSALRLLSFVGFYGKHVSVHSAHVSSFFFYSQALRASWKACLGRD